MTLTRKLINDMRTHGRISIDKTLEALLLEHYGTEPYPHTYTEQDLYEQTRKLIVRYNRDHDLVSLNFFKPGLTRSSRIAPRWR